MGTRRGYGDVEALLAGDETSGARAAARHLEGMGPEAAFLLLSSWNNGGDSPLLGGLRQGVLRQWLELINEKPQTQDRVRTLVDHMRVRSDFADHLLTCGDLIHIIKKPLSKIFDKRGTVIAVCGCDLGAEKLPWSWSHRGAWTKALRGEGGSSVFDPRLGMCPDCANESQAYEETREETVYPPLSTSQREQLFRRGSELLGERLRQFASEEVGADFLAQQAHYAHRHALAELISGEIERVGEGWFSDGIIDSDQYDEIEKATQADKYRGAVAMTDILTPEELGKFAYYEVVAALPSPGAPPVPRAGLQPTTQTFMWALKQRLKQRSIHPAFDPHPSSTHQTWQLPEGEVRERHWDRLSGVDVTYLAEREYDGRWIVTEDKDAAFAFITSRSDEGKFGLDAASLL